MILGEARIPDDHRIYAIGDVHGCINQLNEMLGLIEADLENSPVHEHVIVMLGDYCDRGPDSASVHDVLIKRTNGRNFVSLRGNHDERLLAFLADPVATGDGFLQWGGVQTLDSYDVRNVTAYTHAGLAESLRRNMPDDHITFLESLPYSYTFGDYFFCHAGVRPGISLDQQSHDDLIWIRRDFVDFTEPFEKVIIHGHTPQDGKIDVHPNRINVDSCAYGTGILSCVVLEANTHRVLTAYTG